VALVAGILALAVWCLDRVDRGTVGQKEKETALPAASRA
jgi:hypothetical protein